jgi:hypothetical protein
MAKRKNASSGDSDYNLEDGDYANASDSGSDFAERPAPKKPRKSTKTRTLRVGDASNLDKTLSDEPHDPSRHVIGVAAAENVSQALVDWYGGVHTNRGMPWRKVYNPNSTAEEKGQRAYEVRKCTLPIC